MGAVRVNPTVSSYMLDGWRVRELLDGRVEIRRDFGATDLTYAPWGAVYEAKLFDDTPYPFSFSMRPSIRVEPYYVSGGGVMGFEFPTMAASPLTTLPRIYALRATAVTGQEVRVTVYVTGWRA